MDNSILNSIKKQLGITEEYNVFDKDIIMHINSVFLTLNQLGVGPDNGFYIDDSSDSWTDFIPDGILLNSVKTYVYLKVTLLFDPPGSSAAVDSINRTISELEWRINVQVDPSKREEVTSNGKTK